jgi:hypothetical protein
MATNLELRETVQILNMKYTFIPDTIVFIMRSFCRQRWERTKFKLIMSAQDYEILNWTELNIFSLFYLSYRWEHNVIIMWS